MSQATFTARLRRQLVLHHGLVGESERTYAEALKGRRVFAEPSPDGTGSLVISGDGARITAAQCRIDRIAQRLRKDGDGRTLAQLRADVATDLLLRGWIPNDPTFARLGRPPEATVHVTVSLWTLLGGGAGVGQIPGWGAVSAEQARALALALQAGSIWKRVMTDPLTGRAIEATAGTYRVPAGMATQVTTRDGTCRAPGCEIPAAGADLDHTIEWHQQSTNQHGPRTPECPGGSIEDHTGASTAETNLAALHRGHHNLKTSGFWDSDQSPDGILHWTTATGRTYTTYPYVYDDPDNLPIRCSGLETRLGGRLARVLNPGIPLPGHVSIFDHIDWAEALAPVTPQPRQHTWATARANRSQHAAATAHATDEPPPF